MGFEVHISQLHRWGGRLSDTGVELGVAMRDLSDLAASSPGWATGEALRAWESTLDDLLRSLGERADQAGAAVRACAANYAEADRPLPAVHRVIA